MISYLAKMLPDAARHPFFVILGSIGLILLVYAIVLLHKLVKKRR